MFNSKLKIQKHFSNLKRPYASKTNPFWQFLRHKEKQCFMDMVKDLNKKECMDLGAGSGEYAKILLKMGGKQITCVDFSASLISFVDNPSIKKIISDVEEFETDKKYDLILCLGILEFLNKPKDFVVKLKTLLKPEGALVVLLPRFSFCAFTYAIYYLLKGIIIHPLSLKNVHVFLIQNGFKLESKKPASIFSVLAIYSLYLGAKTCSRSA